MAVRAGPAWPSAGDPLSLRTMPSRTHWVCWDSKTSLARGCWSLMVFICFYMFLYSYNFLYIYTLYVCLSSIILARWSSTDGTTRPERFLQPPSSLSFMIFMLLVAWGLEGLTRSEKIWKAKNHRNSTIHKAFCAEILQLSLDPGDAAHWCVPDALLPSKRTKAVCHCVLVDHVSISGTTQWNSCFAYSARGRIWHLKRYQQSCIIFLSCIPNHEI